MSKSWQLSDWKAATENTQVNSFPPDMMQHSAFYVNLHTELYEEEIWSVWIKSMFEDKVIRSIFGPREEEVRGDWENYIIKVVQLYSSPGKC